MSQDTDRGDREAPRDDPRATGQPVGTPLARLAAGIGRPVSFSTAAKPAIDAILAQRDELSRIVSATVVGSRGYNLVNERLADAVRVPALESVQTFSRMALGSSMLTANLATQTAGVRLASSFAAPDFSALVQSHNAVRTQAESIQRVAALVDERNRVLASLRPQADVARSIAYASRSWNDVVRVSTQVAEGQARALDARQSPATLQRIEVAGRGTGWTIQTGLLLTEPDDETFDELQAGAAAVLGPADASAELRSRLAEVHPALPERLDGAWERLSLGGADAASQAANSLMETVDWTLRLLAPDDAVLLWHTAEGRSEEELHGGKPTRPLRVRYAVRANPEKEPGLTFYLKGLSALVSAIQAPKHSIELRPPRTLVPVALSVEGLLHLLLVE